MKRWIKPLLITALLGYGGWFLWQSNPQVREVFEGWAQPSEHLTLEARFTPEQVMEANRKELLKDNAHSYQDPQLRYYPFVLMEVKFLQKDKSTTEGVVLWGMDDGEMVLNTESWDTTHGFQDCLKAGASRNDFRVINALAEKGALAHEDLQKWLHVEDDVLDSWIEGARQKHLVVQKGTKWQLHFHQPKLGVTPQTKMSHWLVTKPFSGSTRVSGRYSVAQIKRIAQAAFGADFAIRSEKTVYLPVYAIGVQNPDGSVYTSYWNALSGKRLKNDPSVPR